MNRISALSKRLQGDAQVLPPHKQLELWPEKGPCPDMLAPWSQPSSLQNCKQQISALYKLPSLGILLQQPKQAKILWTHTPTQLDVKQMVSFLTTSVCQGINKLRVIIFYLLIIQNGLKCNCKVLWLLIIQDNSSQPNDAKSTKRRQFKRKEGFCSSYHLPGNQR